MDWTNKNIHPSKVTQVGDEVEVMILDIDPERRRISLGIKQCQPNPWEDFAANHNKGDRVKGTIKSITDFGVFVGLEGGIDGLIHLSDLSWGRPGEEAVRDFKKGEEVEAIILAVDPQGGQSLLVHVIGGPGLASGHIFLPSHCCPRAGQNGGPRGMFHRVVAAPQTGPRVSWVVGNPRGHFAFTTLGAV